MGATPVRGAESLFSLRQARIDDARALAELAERTFREAFAAANDADHVDAHCRDSYREDVQAQEILDRERFTIVAEEAAELIGYAQLRWGSAPACVAASAPGEIQRLYVAGAWHGRDAAQRLMRACLEELARRGSDVAWLGVWERNPRAIAFYRKFGFVPTGEQVFQLGGDPQRDLVMVRRIPAGPTDGGGRPWA